MNNSEKRYIELGNFLKSRRESIHPSRVGLPNGMRRRTPGLRREEVAQLAGISLTWYTWLEQGRPINVSDQMLESLCNALLLNKAEHDHLFALAAKSLPITSYFESNPVSASLQNVLDSLELIPAYIIDNKWNVIAWNHCACMIFGDFKKISPQDRNIVWMMFNNHEYMSLFNDWSFHARGVLARFRLTYGKYIGDDWFEAFINRLKTESTFFSKWWSLYDVHGMTNILKEITHPIAGHLSFEFNSFDVSDHINLKLIYHTPINATKEKILHFMAQTN